MAKAEALVVSELEVDDLNKTVALLRQQLADVIEEAQVRFVSHIVCAFSPFLLFLSSVFLIFISEAEWQCGFGH